jgi:xanthine dehydrogenase YagT iron-sulfur-binding subunit
MENDRGQDNQTPEGWGVTREATRLAVRLTVNGVPRDLELEGHETLLSALREHLQLTGTKLGCARGECGACTVLLEGARPHAEHPLSEPAYACLTLAAACDGLRVTTVEGLGTPDALHPLQEAFIRHDALQCGFCTPGQLMAAAALLARSPNASPDDIRREMSGNLCRCGAYPKIAAAVEDAARTMRERAT